MSIFHRHSHIRGRRRTTQWMKELQIQNISENQYLQKDKTDIKAKIAQILASNLFLACMGLVTIYSIFDIDIEKSFFDVNVCVYTSSIHAFCMLLFFIEIILLAYAKDNYIFGFYFWIDVFSTMTMFLELIWIQNIMSNSSNVTVAISLAKLTKASRLSKIGARSSKIMKLIRLMKEFKLLNQQKPQQQSGQFAQIQGQNKQIQVDYEYIQNRSEFQLQKTDRAIPHSKKILNFKSDKLFQMHEKPNNFNQEIIQLDGKSQNSCSISQQADNVNIDYLVNIVFQKGLMKASDNTQKMRKSSRSSRLSFLKRKELMDLNRVKQKQKRFKQVNENNLDTPFSNMIQGLQRNIYLPPIVRKKVDPVLQQMIEERYKKIMERQNQSSSKDKTLLSGQNLKVGELLKEQIQKNIVVLVMGLIIAIPILTSSTWIDNEQSLSLTSNLFFYGMENLTDQARFDLVVDFIQVGLSTNTPLVYLDLPLNDTCCQFPQDFQNLNKNSSFVGINRLRLSEQQIIIDPNYGLTIIFSRRTILSITSMLNVGRSFFITLLLIFSSILFMKDIQTYALEPLQKMSNLINKISVNPFEALKQINLQKEEERKMNDNSNKKKEDNSDKNKLQTNVLQEVVIKITSLLALGAGEVGSQLISQNIDELNPQNQLNHSQNANDGSTHKKHSIKGEKHIAVYVYLRFCFFQQICDVFGDSVFQFINIVTRIIHLNAVRYCGIPIQYDGQGYLLMWKPEQSKQVILEHSHYSLKSQIDTNLAKVSLLAIQYLTKTILDVSELSQTKNLLNFFQQQSNSFEQNYQPHIFFSSIHVGESIQGSMGSPFKLQYKCFGYDISYTRFLSELAQNYGLSNLISSDIIVLIQQFQGIIKDIGIRKIDQIKIKIQKQSDRRKINSQFKKSIEHTKKNLNQYSQTNLANLAYNSIYSLDFYANLYEDFNANQTNQKNQDNGKILTLREKLLLNKTQKQKQKKQSGKQIQSSNQVEKNDEEEKKQSILAYERRDMWHQKIKNCSVFQIHNELKQIHKEVIRQSKKQFKQEFYQTWNDALQCYFLKDWTEALHSFKQLHTQNSFYDYPSKIMIKRIQKHLQDTNEDWDSYEQVIWKTN